MMKVILLFISLFYVAHSEPAVGGFGRTCGAALRNGTVSIFIDIGSTSELWSVGYCDDELNCNGFWGEHVQDTCVDLGDDCSIDPSENWGYCFPNNDMHFFAWFIIIVCGIVGVLILYGIVFYTRKAMEKKREARFGPL